MLRFCHSVSKFAVCGASGQLLNIFIIRIYSYFVIVDLLEDSFVGSCVISRVGFAYA